MSFVSSNWKNQINQKLVVVKLSGSDLILSHKSRLHQINFSVWFLISFWWFPCLCQLNTKHNSDETQKPFTSYNNIYIYPQKCLFSFFHQRVKTFFITFFQENDRSVRYLQWLNLKHIFLDEIYISGMKHVLGRGWYRNESWSMKHNNYHHNY